jgi:hypothetical protein
MSIDAKIESVRVYEDGTGELRLVDRPKRRPGDTPGIAGQGALHFNRAPEEVTALNGANIWGGASSIMLGDREIARRQGYTRIVFADDEAFKAAVTAYRQLERERLGQGATGA